MMGMYGMVLLTGDDGCGKTTAARIYVDAATSHSDVQVSWISSAQFHSIETGAHQQTYIVDDFLGHTYLDSVDKWKYALSFLSKLLKDSWKKNHFLLVTRSSILEKARQSYGADLELILGNSKTITLWLKPQETFNSLVTVQMTPPDFDLTPDVGFPLCCSLVSHLPEHLRPDFFHTPRDTLLTLFRQWFQTDSVAKTACSHLAFTEAYVSKARLLDSPPVGFLGYAPQIFPIQRQLQEQMLAFYHNNPGFILVEEDFVSFRNEAVREAVLTALCETDADLVAHNCSLTLLSRLAMVTSDELNSEDFPKRPPLSQKATTAIVRRMIEEMESGNYRDTLTSHLLCHETFCSKFLTELQNSHLKRLLQQNDTHGLPLLFWSGACKDVFSRVLKLTNMSGACSTVQALLACCFWGHSTSINKLFRKLSSGAKKSLKNFTLEQLLSKYLDISSSQPELVEGIPFYTDDTLITLAAWRGHDDVVKCLLEHEFPINSTGHNNTSSLMHFTSRGNVEMVEYLLARNADPCLADDFDMTALHYAVGRKEWAVPRRLFHENNINAKNFLGGTPLEVACAAGWSVTGIQQLLKNGACLQPDSRALEWACLNKMDLVVSTLTEMRDVDDSGHAWLILTACLIELERHDLLQQILKIHSVQNVLEHRNLHVLNTAASTSSKHVVKTLLRTHTPTQDIMNTALHGACHTGNVPVMKLLLQENAQLVCKINGEWKNSFQIACERGHKECVETLVLHPDVCNSQTLLKDAFLGALGHRQLPIARFLLNRFSSTNIYGETLLHKVVIADSPVVLDWCMKECPGDINATDEDEEKITPFALACSLGKRSAAMWLADHGADLTVKDSHGSTCLHLAARNDHRDLVTALLNMDPPLDRNIRDKDGNTPLDVAIL